jgi:predicted phosphodiesterase
MTADDITRMAIEIIRQYPDHPARSLARRLVEAANGAITLDSARSRIRFQLGQSGVRKRKSGATGFERPSRQPGEGVAMPVSKAAAWEPFDPQLPGLWGVLSDIHVPYHSEVALKAAVEHLKERQIVGLLLNGDIADFYSISRYVKNPANRDFGDELAQVRQLLKWLRQEFPDAKIIYKQGNHEERYQHWLWQHAAELSLQPEMGLDVWLHCNLLDIRMVGEQLPVLLGKLPVLHGHEKGKGMTAPVNQARGAFLRLHHTVLEGHGHRTSGHCEPDMWGNEVFCWSTGCLADLRPEYARLNKYNHGFATVDVHDDGSFDVQNMRITKDGVVRTS